MEIDMTDEQKFPENDPRHHTQKLKQMLNDTAAHAREDVAKISDPKAQALFETAAEVLKGLAKAFEDFEQKQERAWKQSA
jgi:HD-like signal output (HDOD) protein